MGAMQNLLKEIGFSENEAKVYLALLALGETATGSVIKKTGLHRNIVYTELERLVVKSFAMRVTKNKKLYFIPLDPARLAQEFKRKEELLTQRLPDLIGLYKKRASEITIHEGITSWQAYWLNAAQTFPAGSIDQIAGAVGERWYELWGSERRYAQYAALRRRRKIKWRMIVYRKEEADLNVWRADPQLTELRLVNYEINRLGNFHIWDEALILQVTEEPPLIIEIKNAVLVKIFKQYFDFLWRLGKPIKIKK